MTLTCGVNESLGFKNEGLMLQTRLVIITSEYIFVTRRSFRRSPSPHFDPK